MSNAFQDKLNQIEAKVNRLLTAAKEKTKKDDTNLTDAVNTLIEGYGTGDDVIIEELPEYDGEIVGIYGEPEEEEYCESLPEYDGEIIGIYGEPEEEIGELIEEWDISEHTITKGGSE